MSATPSVSLAALLAALIAAGAAVATAGCSASSVPGGGSGGSSGAGTGGANTGLGGVSGGAGGATASGDGGFDSGTAGMGGAMGLGGATGPGGASGTGGAPARCVVSAAMVSPPYETQVEVFPGAHVRMRASAPGATIVPATFAWTVIRTDQPAVNIETTSPDATRSVADFPVDGEGTYQATVRVVGESCGQWTLHPIAQRAVFTLRATAKGIPLQEKPLSLSGAANQLPVTVVLDPGTSVRVDPRDFDDNQLPTFVRVSPAASDLKVEGDTIHGPLPTPLIASTVYDLLIIPAGTLAPKLFTGTPDSLQAQDLRIDAGIPINATVRDRLGRPLAGVRAIVRQGALPSTVGSSDASGAMTIFARTGTLAAYFVPPDASGLPQASVGVNGSAGVVLDQTLNAQMTWDATATAALTVTVSAPDGTTRLPGARVRATSRGAAVPVATLVVGTGPARTTRRAVGSTDVEAITDGSGVALFPTLSVGDFTVTVVPPASMDAASGAALDMAVTSVPVTLTGAGLPLPVTLARKVSLSGLVLPARDSAGATITAIDTSINAPGRVVTATVGADGRYSLRLDPARSYQLTADTVVSTAVARAALGIATSGTADSTTTDRTLPATHLVTGTLMTIAGPTANARLQLFCPAWSLQCADADFVWADVVTDARGGFQLRVPEPPPPRPN